MWRWNSFKPEEVLSQDGLIALQKGVYVIQPVLMDTLEAFREKVGSPLLVNHSGLTYRGYRSFGENKMAGGERFSFHMQGLAVDISCNNVDIEYLYQKAKEFIWTGIGFYPKKHFVHCDLRTTVDGKRMMWNG